MDIERLFFSSLAEAKAKFSKMVDLTKEKDVVITRNGIPQAVLIDYERYKKLMKFYDEVRDLYLLEVGDPSSFKVEMELEEDEEV